MHPRVWLRGQGSDLEPLGLGFKTQRRQFFPTVLILVDRVTWYILLLLVEGGRYLMKLVEMTKAGPYTTVTKTKRKKILHRKDRQWTARYTVNNKKQKDELACIGL